MSPLHTLDAQALQWLRAGAGWSQLPWATRAQLSWRSSWAGLNRGLSTARVAEAPGLAAPMFIAGPWRSGTTVMHELLAAATGWPTPRTWQCMNASAFQLLPAPPTQIAVARPMDGLEISAQSPQEDEFALLCLGVDSAYRAFLMPERLGELTHTLDPEYWQRTAAQWLPRFEAFLQGVLASEAALGRRLLLKSPNHSFRLPALLQRYAQAQVVWMAREPDAVFHSNRKMWLAMFAEHALAVSSAAGVDPTLDQFLARALHACAEVLDQLPSLAPGRFVVSSQEALLTNPRGELQRVLMALNLSITDPQALELALARVARGRIEHYATPLPSAAQAAAQALAQAQARAPR
jgi:hypothetical protein